LDTAGVKAIAADGVGTMLETRSVCTWKGVGERSVSKALVTKQELERLALQEIISFPGCEHVTDVEIEYQLDKEYDTNWAIHVFTRDGGDMAKIQYAINTTRKRLRHRYDLRTES
jgi:hypothetical protein